MNIEKLLDKYFEHTLLIMTLKKPIKDGINIIDEIVKIKQELLSRLARGERAIKAMEKIKDLRSQWRSRGFYNGDYIDLIHNIIKEYEKE